MAQPFSNVTWWVRSGQGFSGKRRLFCPRARSARAGPAVHAHTEGDRERRRLPRVALQLSLLHAAAASSSLMHRKEAARGFVDVHDAVWADSVLVHEPAQLGEEPVRVGLLQCRAVELFQALGGLLESQVHATQEFLDPPLARTHVESLCVEPVVIVTALRHSTSVTFKMCSLSRVMSAGDSKACRASLLVPYSVPSGKECSG